MGSQDPCIYRVPSQLREVNPEAYRPRMLLIGPLTHSKKPKVHTDSRYLEYKMMEDQKVLYKDAFTKRLDTDIAILEDMKTTIKDEEVNIRASYAVSTAWILSDIFVELILNDSIFIVEFILRMYESHEKIGDMIVDKPFYTSTVLDDLTLLENQLPYFCLSKLLNPITKRFCGDQSLDQVILQLFSVNDSGMINENTKFNHFTDLFRCVYKESLGQNLELNNSKSQIVDMKSANMLYSVGVDFKVVKREYSLNVSFEEGCLILPSFPADESSNIILRNVIAYEQCHDPENAFTTNYINFMNFLITSDEDVAILTSAGVLTNGVGRSSMVLKMVNNLAIGVLLSNQSQYHDIVEKLNIHHSSRRKRIWAKLRKVYFSDLWTTTATLAAISLLLLTLAGTVASIFQAIKS
ncbi:Hypothetical protein [Arabidopsis thaliana]|uniref:F5A8.6 protein n=1 Tax=Arabidopsis thaliana TaxID=3702 RepID=Q9ZW92_ARATH|nr:transmembrane protein, putative (DUF247) [Arabidopsis thaliana]NP_176886.1 transmembrane protein, putative (DUF247) [Arabidopsis thaliana]AAD10660.1 Hypothetical protein [Arabidopsis thaliana]AAT68334.1 hypothetical protein At1g67150 [Arabidopsis thaliana]AAX23792.1 hypothetical protein At1g67150 [Arabidopsis thaliana]AEE34604.1 transmembrane protein, putative (DUF247) [Arabidopsis thaliana]ANM59764.1 transmembrane protein, putative (DUF247) [Arabidopsis thaliana]|eukprot:NP_001322099.1 transmembrane protein, putative (DUF247) [Arabidopsis thaliana]